MTWRLAHRPRGGLTSKLPLINAPRGDHGTRRHHFSENTPKSIATYTVGISLDLSLRPAHSPLRCLPPGGFVSPLLHPLQKRTSSLPGECILVDPTQEQAGRPSRLLQFRPRRQLLCRRHTTTSIALSLSKVEPAARRVEGHRPPKPSPHITRTSFLVQHPDTMKTVTFAEANGVSTMPKAPKVTSE
jgi:hypothetical protein